MEEKQGVQLHKTILSVALVLWGVNMRLREATKVGSCVLMASNHPA